MSALNLFNIQNSEVENFMNKINSVHKSYSQIYGKDFVDEIELLLTEYNDMKEYHETMAAINKEQQLKVEEYKQFKNHSSDKYFNEAAFNLYDGNSYRIEKADYDLEAKKTRIIGLLRGCLTSKVHKKWNIDLEFNFKSSDITIEQIFEQLSFATKNGDFDEIERDQVLGNLKNQVIKKVGEFEFKNNKLSINRFAYSYKCNINKEYEATISSDQRKAFIASLELLAKELHLEEKCTRNALFPPHVILKDLNQHLDKLKEGRGAYDEEVFLKNNFIEKVKLLKNGKLEIIFASEEVANKYFLDFIHKCRQLS